MRMVAHLEDLVEAEKVANDDVAMRLQDRQGDKVMKVATVVVGEERVPDQTGCTTSTESEAKLRRSGAL